ncbi:SIR2 family protein [Bacteroides gallinaceum]|uniref:SIR2 family protein n=1 Tax=Bacteroides gallinaceum TaxID=1462571 RepID=A0ABT7X1W0_9BACE|nr:SIR2 family protein [Bacteroides gallinaceum]MBM6944442.1 SIR2 family protein [Bacteroides gallinaceum]MDN0048046.1 SIR2 family protein [Bacteroides gallinaceum]
MLQVDITISQGTSDLLASLKSDAKPEEKLDFVKNKIREFFNLKNINFLFGSGTSSGAIPTMDGLFKELKFDKKKEVDEKEEFECIVNKVGKNLEATLEVMYSARTYYDGILTDDESVEEYKKLYNRLIHRIEEYIFNSINVDMAKDASKKVLGYYKTFYQKIALRNKDLSRIRVFTTNNDLFNETALDSLNIHYINGFGGGLRKYFNPALFNYTWSKRMDTSIDKYEPVENMVYLYKIHGSINWQETEHKMNNYFNIEELSPQQVSPEKSVLIYPTPTKQDKSLGVPYVDLFREFQNKLLEPHSVLFVIGYGFNDRHVNDIIYRALATNSTINVVIFSKKPEEDEKTKKPIFFINDNRIFTISGKVWNEVQDERGEITKNNERTINYFDYIVDELLPNLDSFRKEENMLEEFVKQLNETKTV